MDREVSAHHTPYEPSDEEIIAWIKEHYNTTLAEQAQAAIRSTAMFGQHVRRSFIHEMLEER